MGSVVTTFLLAFGVIILALLFLGIGWLITGKPRIIRGACGMDPEKARDERCGRDISCEICKKPTNDKDMEDDESVHQTKS